MRSPSRPDTQDHQAFQAAPVHRDPSVPDRERIDSDVRAFMRPVSTPWITFDRDSRVDGELAFAAKAAMRAGVAFMSSPDLSPPVMVENLGARMTPVPVPTGASRLADINAMFPPSVPGQRASSAQDEPSSLIVAADVVPAELPLSGDPALTKPSGRLGFFAATMGAVGVCSIAAYVVASLQMAPAPARAAAAVAAPKVEAVAPPEPVAELAPVIEVEAAPAAAPAPPAAEVVGESSTDPKKRWGKLTIKGDATKKNVWFDGKRMLGSGNRTFLVFCGKHTIAVSDKTTTIDTEVPCNGELTIEK